MSNLRLIVVVLLAGIVAAFFVFDFHLLLSLDSFKAQQEGLKSYIAENYLFSSFLYFIVYILVTALSLPGAALMTLIGGALFGFWSGLILASFASTIGATLAFLLSRWLFRDFVQNRFGERLKPINRGFEKEGAFYLFGLRLVPVFPFFLINIAMGLTPIKPLVFALVSQVGMLAGTIVYVNAGTQIGGLESFNGLLSPELVISFVILGLFPLLAKKLLSSMKRRNVLKRFTKPDRFDYNMIVIGGGSAGLVSSYIGTTVKARVALIESAKMGGDCLNSGCVPSKALIRRARFLADIKKSALLGIRKAEAEFDFSELMESVQKSIEQIAPHDSVERYREMGVDCVEGRAKITSPWSVEVNGKTLTTRSVIIATGATPVIPELKGLRDSNYFTSDTIWSLRKLPEKMVVLGAGPIACELAQCFARFGTDVSIVFRGKRLLNAEDEEVSRFLESNFLKEGIKLYDSSNVLEVVKKGQTTQLVLKHDQEEKLLNFDALLVAYGRKATTKGLWDREVEISKNKNGTIEVDETMQSTVPTIYVCGDVTGPYQFTHAAAHQAWYAAVNALFGSLWSFKVDYGHMPRVTFTDPEIAVVGLNEQSAKAKEISYEVTRYDLSELDRAIVDQVNKGWVKVLTVPGKDKLLGVTIVGQHAGELVTEFVTAMKQGSGLNNMLGTIHAYPTMSEANKYVAGEWKRNHAPETLLKWVGKFHNWRLKSGENENIQFTARSK